MYPLHEAGGEVKDGAEGWGVMTQVGPEWPRHGIKKWGEEETMFAFKACSGGGGNRSPTGCLFGPLNNSVWWEKRQGWGWQVASVEGAP